MFPDCIPCAKTDFSILFIQAEIKGWKDKRMERLCCLPSLKFSYISNLKMLL